VEHEAGTSVRVPPAGRVVCIALLGFVAAFAVYASWEAARDHFTTPYYDDWRLLDEMLGGQTGPFHLADHNGHRLPLTRLLYELDYRAFGGHMHLPVGVSLVCVWLTASVYLTTWGPSRFRSPALLFALYTWFWATAYFDTPWALHQAIVAALAWSTVALAALVRYQRVRGSIGFEPGAAIIAASLAAVCATFSAGYGVASCAALLIVSLIAGLPARVVCWFAILGLGTTALYGIGLRHPPGNPARLLQALERPLDTLGMALSVVGSSVATAVSAWIPLTMETRWWLSTVAGVVGTFLFLALVRARRQQSRSLSAPEMLGFGLMAFTLAAACLVGLARAGFRWDVGIRPRFVSTSSLFWIGLVCAGIRERSGPAPALALFAVALAMLPAYRLVVAQRASLRDVLALNATWYLLGIRSDAEIRRTLYVKSPEQVYRVLDRLRHDGRSIFAEPRAATVARPLADVFEISLVPCPGSARVVALQTEGILGGRVTGHVASRAVAPSSGIAITDASGIVRGLGVLMRFEAPVDAIGRRVDGATAWRGVIADWRPSAPYRAYAVDYDARTACLVTALLDRASPPTGPRDRRRSPSLPTADEPR